MKLTNIRFDDNFIIFDNGEFYLSKINKDDFDDFTKDKSSLDLSTSKGDNVTEKLGELMKEYDIYSHVNFCGFDIQTGGG